MCLALKFNKIRVKDESCLIPLPHYPEPSNSFDLYREREQLELLSHLRRFNVLGALNAMTHDLVLVTNQTYITALEVAELLTRLAQQELTARADGGAGQCALPTLWLRAVGGGATRHRVVVPAAVLPELESD